MRRVRQILLIVVLLVAAGLAYGPLFAWSPLTPGFSRIRTTHAAVTFRNPPGLSIPPEDIERAIVRLQSDIGLDFRAPVQFVLCDEWSDLIRFTPWLRLPHGVGAITLPIGLMTYVTPTARTRADLLDFMAHEAAHSLLYQHASIRDRLEMERQAWFVEGLAVHFGNSRAYGSLGELGNMGSPAQIVAIIDAPENGNRRASVDPRFRYSAYGHFIGYLNTRFGGDRCRGFTAAYIGDPASYRQEFQQVFGVPLGDVARAFAESIDRPRQ